MKPTPLGWTDPRKEEGELLWPELFPEQKVKEMEKSLGSYGTAGQLQQRPVPREGGMIKRDWIKIVERAPTGIKTSIRWWDKGSTEGGGDYTAGVKISKVQVGGVERYFIEHVVRGQWSSGTRNEIMKQTAMMDGIEVNIWTEQEPGSGGKDSADDTIRMLSRWTVRAEKSTGDKAVRFGPFAAQAEAGNVFIVRGDWNADYLDEICIFPNGKHDDQVDATSGGYNKIVLASFGTDDFGYDKDAKSIIDSMPAGVFNS